VHGDATAIDLGYGRTIVALLGPADALDQVTRPEYLAMRAFGLTRGDTSIPEIAKQTGVRRLEGRDIPAFVIFSDRRDPNSAQRLKRTEGEQDLAPGKRLIAVTIEITSGPITREIDRKLPWWSAGGRPASQARRAWLAGRTDGPSVEPETLFRSASSPFIVSTSVALLKSTYPAYLQPWQLCQWLTLKSSWSVNCHYRYN
jgi:hypothetical protein